MKTHFNFDNSYVNLPHELYSLQTPTKVDAPSMTIFNTKLAKKLNLNYEKSFYKKFIN
jgi:uncharacterized protein YdiU (UPF0061 family)